MSVCRRPHSTGCKIGCGKIPGLTIGHGQWIRLSRKPWRNDESTLWRRLPAVTVNFPNSSRSYDARREGVRFWGYDSAMEVPFFVRAEALRKLDPAIEPGEAGCLASFDARRRRIEEAARKVYRRGLREGYELSMDDL